MWKSPRTLVGGEALKKALKAQAAKEARAKRGSASGGEGGGAGVLGASGRGSDRIGSGALRLGSGALEEAAEEEDVGDEVSVDIPYATFDRNKRVVERHSEK